MKINYERPLDNEDDVSLIFSFSIIAIRLFNIKLIVKPLEGAEIISGPFSGFQQMPTGSSSPSSHYLWTDSSRLAS